MIETILLGTAQDGGVPHAGCTCPTCSAAWANPALQQHPTCLGLVDHTTRRFWLIDATPALPTQLFHLRNRGDRKGALLPVSDPRPLTSDPSASLRTSLRFSGILLTHAHIGHYTGLIHLGREVMNTGHLPVYATPRMATFLRDNAPWSGLVDDGNIDLVELEPDREMALSPDLHITPISVPHREEYSDTVAYLVCGPKRSLFYCPDIDGWDDFEFEMTVTSALTETDLGPNELFWRITSGDSDLIALLDGSFFSTAELPGRDLADIPHPLVTDTVARFGAQTSITNVYFIHLNHSNPLWQDGLERAWLAERGFQVGLFGQRWEL